MNKWNRKLALGLLVLATVALMIWDSGLSSNASASGPDRDPPVVMVQAVDALQADSPLVVGAQIVDPSGPGRVVLWVRGEHEEEFRKVPMEPDGENHVRVELDPWPERGSLVAYYIEARDAKGNGPAYAGGPRTPYVIRLEGATALAKEAKTNWVLWAVTAGCLVVLVCGFILHRRFSQERIHAELNAELNRLTGSASEPEPAVKEPVEEPARARSTPRIPQNPAEQAFWVGLLSPLRDMGSFDREHALKNLAVRPQYHPRLGKRFFDVATLSRHFQWVESGEIKITREMVTAGGPVPEEHESPTPGSSPG